MRTMTTMTNIMHYKIIPIGTLLISLLSAAFCQAESVPAISGEVVNGYRILAFDPAVKESAFTVYRGDYIKFSYPAESGPLAFAVPAFKYRDLLQPDPDKSPYFKMTTTGTYEFSLGQAAGKIEVIDLVRTNYIEVSAGQAAEILRNINPFILDVRTPGENGQLRLADSHLIPIQTLQARIQELAPKKHEDIFIYCATGNRSTVASKILADLGFKRIYNLRYGIYDWARRGFPIIR